FGFLLGAAIFLTWAICREIDPDYDYSAFVHIPFTIAAMIAYGVPNVFFLLLLLHFCRMVNRSSGYHATWFESIIWFVVGGVMVFIGDIVAGYTMAAAYIADGLMKEPLKRHLYFGVCSFVLATVYLILRIMQKGIVPLQNVEMWEIITAVIIAVIYIPVIIMTKQIHCKCDGGQDFDSARVRILQVLVLFAGVGYVFMEGRSGIQLSSPLWTAMLGIALYRYYSKLKK
ncbi:MAG TPA: hypothetical protein VK004_02825, partial [Ignavibacteria bacterium]|nr:hypothetical protein [Ignavibacteria bacterium]